VLQVGDTLPAATVFLGPGQPVTLLELVEDGPKLIVFYPFDWSSTCTNEMELVRDRRTDFEEVGVQPVGISRDSPWCHIAWTQVLDLNFGLLSDFNGEAVRAFGVGFDFRGFRDVAQRSAFLVDETATVLASWQYPSGDVPNVDDWLEAARTLKPAPTSG
jgi:glutaredoxin-dependent peroxiredoxin